MVRSILYLGPEPIGCRPPVASAVPPDPSTDPTSPERPADEPSLRSHLVERWRSAPLAVRAVLVLVVLAVVAWILVPRVIEAAEGPSEEERLAQAALDRAQYAEMLRRSPKELGMEPVSDALGPGDAERADDRYADYYVHEADSVAFSILVTSDDFSPDLSVRLPSGQTIAASNLLRTATRAEIDGLMGPGRFEIVVTSERPRAEGRYELAVVPASAADSVYVDGEARLDTLGVGPKAGPLRAGRYERAYGISAGSDLPVIVRVVSSAFVPRVSLLGPNGEVQGAWRSMERSSQGDSLHGVVLRYLPGWDAAYRLIVSSESRAATGPFAIDVRSIDIRRLSTGGSLDATLGDDSWVEDGRYVDSYRFRIGDDVETTLAIESEAFPPAFRLWKIQRRARADVAENLNEDREPAIEYTAKLDAGEYFLEVTAGGPDSTQTRGGDYRVSVTTESIAPPPQRTFDRGPSPETKVFSTEVRRTGESGGSSFEVGVTNVAISYPGEQRTRVQLSITVRSIDYSGGWAPWASFAGQAYIVDGQGRRYSSDPSESQSPSGLRAEPGTARRGTVVFYLPEVATNIDRLVLVASIGERRLTLPIPVP